ncbi:hypothetical protein PUNSTDRAFT_131802 [Punctularia strigosozonata HHB-11173 SS5]|uniref:uncharacterized protein n=1 Tax=Punctularia strigosozonata (strain HHB-11173) TaxID=741275 RepID=UPI00044163FE|nr:uncharacterized protein PUNSTDRAFT_131802 [Punctularia strigosozonata HHB-11173 SS5]EIN11643.1 hypothetical protein PUNSTDRAFT_131802 [Punctularia strigosozonata HHB-11173 SS5]
MASDLERYISDNALEFFGLADKSIVDYVIASASSSKSAESLFAALNASGFPDTPSSHAFVSEVYSRVPRKHKHKSSAAKDTPSLQPQKYSFVLDDDDAGKDVVEQPREKKKRTEGGKKKRHTRKREADAGRWESDGEDDNTQVRK